MGASNFSGPVVSGGGFTGPVTGSGVPAFIVGEIRVPITVTAATTTDFTVTVPAGAFLQSASTYTTTAFGAVTDATISIGTTVGGAEVVAATTVKAAGLKNHTLLDSAVATLTSLPTTLRVRITQSGGNSAVGAATLCLRLSMPLS